jgi:hypothetical protein
MHRTIPSQLFLVLVLLLPLKSFGIPADCNNEMRKSYWNLPPKSQQLVVGTLAETNDDLKLLAVTDYYWGSHESIYEYLQKKYSLKRVVWSGEMLIENPENQPGKGSIVLTINTAGFSWKVLKDPHINDPQMLKENIEAYRPDLTTQFTQFDSYSDEHAHLDPFFRVLHQRRLYTNKESVRHQFRNILNVVFFLASNLSKNPSPSLENETKIWNKVSRGSASDVSIFLNSLARYSPNRFSGIPIEQINVEETREAENEEPEVFILNPPPSPDRRP